MMFATMLTRMLKSVQYQYSDLAARPPKSTYLAQTRIDRLYEIHFNPPGCNQRIRPQRTVTFQRVAHSFRAIRFVGRRQAAKHIRGRDGMAPANIRDPQ